MAERAVADTTARQGSWALILKGDREYGQSAFPTRFTRRLRRLGTFMGTGSVQWEAKTFAVYDLG